MQSFAAATTVHQDHPNPSRFHKLRHLVIKTKSANVIDDLSSRLNSTPRDLRTIGIDRNRNFNTTSKRFDYWQDSPCFFFFRYGFAAGPSRLAANINDVGALLLHLFA